MGYITSFPYDYIESIDFSSDSTILEYDVLFLDLSHIFDSYFSVNQFDYEEYKGRPKLTESNSVQIKRDFEKRKNELIEFLESGKTVVVFNSNEQVVARYTGATRTSGTGKSARVTPILEGVHSIEYLPISVSATSLGGTSIDVTNHSMKDKMKEFLPHLTYLSTYQNVNNVLMTIKSSKKAISYYEEYGKGMILFVPDLYFTNESADDIPKIEMDYYNFLCDLPKLLRKKDSELPEYSNDYYLFQEKDKILEVEKLQKQIEEKQKKLEKEKMDLLEIQNNKIFFTGTGTPLEICIRDLLEEIGFEILYYDPDGVRKDIEIGYKDRVAVVEVKGVSGSATEKHVSQVVKWKAEYHIENDVIPKGFLIVNAFNMTPLSDRQEYFPEQLLKYSNSQEIGLFTTTQIYNIKCFLEKNPDCRDKIIDSMFDCIGRYNQYADWKENIEERINEN